jgi:hypothetical protein
MLNFADGTQFTSGCAPYFDQEPEQGESRAKVFVRIDPGGIGPVLALLDTGAAWSVLDAEIAEAMSLLDGDGEPIRMTTRLGHFNGRLEDAHLTLLAQDGESLEVNARVFVSPEWPGRTFLGYMGMLERIRFALDPQQNHFHFGGY